MDKFYFEFDNCLKHYSNKTAVIYYDSCKEPSNKIVKLNYQQVFETSENIKKLLNNYLPNNVGIAIFIQESLPILPSIIIGYFN